MHISILALGSRGDVQPYATLGKALQTAGHTVRFITFTNFAPLIAEHGLDFYPIQGNAQDLVAQTGAKMLALVRSFSKLAAGYARDLSAPHVGQTDLIINQLPGGLYGFDLAEKYGVKMVLAAVMPLAPTRAFPFMAFPPLPLPGYNRLTYSLGEQMVWQMYRRVINRWRTQTLGLPPTPLGGCFRQLGTAEIPILNGFSELVVPRPPDWNPHIHLTGYWFPEEEAWQPSAALQDFLEAGSPPVFIGFGSMPIKDPQRTTQIVLDAVRHSGQRAILQMGWGGLGQQRDLPPTVFQIDSAPYSWLFPRMGMVIHHGGSGTTAAGLRAGVPSCIVPFLFDQFYWGARVAALGVGPDPIPHKKLTAEHLAHAIGRGFTDLAMRRQAAELGGRLRMENGLQTARHLVDTWAHTPQK